ncbi:hypothetical protein Aab01nite_37200 [Paractinoplanes abujensis]|uniref:PatA-like N-terminal domain-containing protein n=1 Tax=Paractinoplanes abujensis TaxID=882441 RepID=A0A7W7CX58_9ACTN|nr:DUF4388 domain-containing protein [Actinoplanes abujensis]MBB4694656.1 hypothetical protein [Actinoplanes abujensis]GID20130.1 hypothetical protein Aab01nite_37200 [Actinoplanes abujensis]
MIPGSPATAGLRRLLTELGESARTGALHIDGHPGGVLYLVSGRIAYAETPACPGIGDRLVASGRIPAAVWRRALAEGRGAHRVGRLLLRDGLIGQNELALRLAAAIADATHELLRSAEARVRFVPGERHWLGPVAGLEPARRFRAGGGRNACPQPWSRKPPTMTHMGCD